VATAFSLDWPIEAPPNGGWQVFGTVFVMWRCAQLTKVWKPELEAARRHSDEGREKGSERAARPNGTSHINDAIAISVTSINRFLPSLAELGATTSLNSVL
jgi:hypothetical protein